MSEIKLDLNTWFTDRELLYKPKHFVVTKTPITSESKKWIYDKLKGRFTLLTIEMVNFIHPTNIVIDSALSNTEYPAFEDPAEATFYELTWS